MKEYEFPYFVSFGPGDSGESSVTCNLSEKMAKRLEASAHEGNRFRLDDDESLSDIYEKVYKAVLNQEREVLLEDEDNLSQVQDFLAEEDDEYDYDQPVTKKQIEQYLDELMIGINFPEHLQMLPEPNYGNRE